MFENVPLLLGRFFDIDRHDRDAQYPGSEIKQDRLVVVEQDGRHAISAPQTQHLTHERHQPLEPLAELGIPVFSLDTTILVHVDQEGTVGKLRIFDTGTNELGERFPGEGKVAFQSPRLENGVSHAH